MSLGFGVVVVAGYLMYQFITGIIPIIQKAGLNPTDSHLTFSEQSGLFLFDMISAMFLFGVICVLIPQLIRWAWSKDDTSGTKQ